MSTKEKARRRVNWVIYFSKINSCMDYLNNKYTKYYYAIISNAQTRTLETYTECHHIVPKSLGGSNTKDNLVRLTAREHFICHRLLTKMTTGTDKQKMCVAVHKMCSVTNKQQRYTVNARTYERIRSELGKAISALKKGTHTGENNPNYGKKHSEETLQKMREAAKNRPRKPHSEETKRKMAIAATGRIKSAEEIAKLKAKRATQVFSEETRAKMSASHKGKKKKPH